LSKQASLNKSKLTKQQVIPYKQKRRSPKGELADHATVMFPNPMMSAEQYAMLFLAY